MRAVKDEARWVYAETYEDVEDVADVPRFNQWFELVTGWLPVRFDGGFCIVLWEVVLEHGRRYVRYIQNHYGKARAPGYIDTQVEGVGGMFPF